MMNKIPNLKKEIVNYCSYKKGVPFALTVTALVVGILGILASQGLLGQRISDLVKKIPDNMGGKNFVLDVGIGLVAISSLCFFIIYQKTTHERKTRTPIQSSEDTDVKSAPAAPQPTAIPTSAPQPVAVVVSGSPIPNATNPNPPTVIVSATYTPLTFSIPSPVQRNQVSSLPVALPSAVQQTPQTEQPRAIPADTPRAALNPNDHPPVVQQTPPTEQPPRDIPADTPRAVPEESNDPQAVAQPDVSRVAYYQQPAPVIVVAAPRSTLQPPVPGNGARESRGRPQQRSQNSRTQPAWDQPIVAGRKPPSWFQRTRKAIGEQADKIFN